MNISVLNAIELAELAYEEPQHKNTVFIESEDTQVMIRFYEDRACISFRGTQSIKDFITDARFIKGKYKPLGDGKLHRGFRDAYDCVRKQIFIELEKRRIKTIYFASHSLGAALSCICALDMAHNYAHQYKIKSLHLFGCPRVFNSKMAKRYDRLLKNVTFRWQNNCDIVCRIPKLFYRHVGQRQYIDRNGNLRWFMSWRNRLADRVLGNLKGISKFKYDSFNDHKTESYKTAIQNLTRKGII